MSKFTSGSEKTGFNPGIKLRGMSLERLLCVYPGEGWDHPLPNIAGFDRLSAEGDRWQIEWLVDWIEPQTTCEYVMEHHGPDGLSRVLEGIARACVEHHVHMKNRVASAAGCLGLGLA